MSDYAGMIKLDGVWPYECPIKFEELNCEEIANRHAECVDPDCLVCGLHEVLACESGSV